ncbi:flavin reductase family protein [Aliiglaciecola litoralis]|uniref:Flavin reductase family protein n=1 Tax=Aliiglaciecola litoralis TaxID=582857 RepID=A0ABP3WPP8_9ALTE
MPDTTHFYEPKLGHNLSHDPFNAIIAPRPIGWISTLANKGQANLAPYSFFNAFNYQPPLIGFASVGDKDTLNNARRTGEFCWNLATVELAQAMNLTSKDTGQDEFELAGLTKRTSKIINPPQVAESPVVMECKTSQIIQLQSAKGELCDSWLVIGEVVGVHIDKSLIENGVYQTVKGQPILRGGGAGDYYSINETNKFEMLRPK